MLKPRLRTPCPTLSKRESHLSRFAGVCLLDNPFSIDGVYDYVIPEELAGAISAGSFVRFLLVPPINADWHW